MLQCQDCTSCSCEALRRAAWGLGVSGTGENRRETLFYLQRFMPKARPIFSHLHSNLQSKHGTRFSRVSGQNCWLCFEEFEFIFNFYIYSFQIYSYISDSVYLCLCSYAQSTWRFLKWLPAVHVLHIISCLKTNLSSFLIPNNVWILIKNVSPAMSVLGWLPLLSCREVTKINRPWC